MKVRTLTLLYGQETRTRTSPFLVQSSLLLMVSKRVREECLSSPLRDSSCPCATKVYLSVRQSQSLSVRQSPSLSVRQSLSLSIRQSPSLSVRQSLSLSVRQSLSMFACLCLSVCYFHSQSSEHYHYLVILKLNPYFSFLLSVPGVEAPSPVRYQATGSAVLTPPSSSKNSK